MAQNFNSLKASSLIKNDRQTINDNFDAVRSCHSGTAYPTAELVAGMLFFNTSTKKSYEYTGSAWVQTFDLSSGTAVAVKAGKTDSATKATGDNNGKDITTYVAKLEQDANNKFAIRVYNGDDTLMTTITIPETEVDVMTGASSSSVGKAGLVPAPSAGVKNRYLNAYGDFETIDIPIKSVNGKTGDVVVGEVTNLSISGKTITVTFADATTKTLTIKSDMPYTGATGITVSVNTATGDGYTAPNDGWLAVNSISSGADKNWVRVYNTARQALSILNTVGNTHNNRIIFPVAKGGKLKITKGDNITISDVYFYPAQSEV